MKEEEEVRPIWDRPIVLFLIIAGVGTILLLPLVSAFDSTITQIAIMTNLDVLIKEAILPRVVSMIAAILNVLSFQTTVYNYELLAVTRGVRTVWVVLLWNCVGWQTLILLLSTLVVGLSGSYTRMSKIICIVLGFQFTFFISSLRILLVCIIAYFWGTLPAITFHEYGGSILVLLSLFLFWFISFKWVLVKAE